MKEALKLAVAAAGIALLGIVLGDIVDKSLRRGLVISDGDLAPFFTRPMAGVLAAIVILTVLLQFEGVRRMLGRFLPGTSRIRTEGDST